MKRKFMKRLFANFNKGLFILLLSVWTMHLSLAQISIPQFPQQTEWLEQTDQKKWSKFIDRHSDADNLLKQSNELYLQASTLAQEAGVDYEKNQKEVDKLEKKAFEIQLKALKEYREIYTGMYLLVVSYLSESDKNDATYSEMLYYAEEADGLYGEIKKIENKTDKDKLTRANEHKLNAVEHAIAILSGTAGETYTSGIIQTGPVKDNEFVIDNELYQRYKKYISDSSIPNPVDATQLMDLEGDSATFNAFSQLWQQYTIDGKLPEQAKVETTEEPGFSEQEEQISEAVITEQQPTTSQTDAAPKAENETTREDKFQQERIESESLYTSAIEASNKVDNNYFERVGRLNEFRIQIAASKIPLSLSQVKTIYPGNLTIVEFKEGSYYKYQIRGINRFSRAQSICSNTKVTNAFLQAYNESGNISLSEAVVNARQFEDDVRNPGFENDYLNIEFSVQIAASRVRLSTEQLENLYSHDYPVSVVFEEGWYKYQILAGKNLKYALEVLESSGVRKAFLVAYKEGKKIKLYKAINEYKTYTQ